MSGCPLPPADRTHHEQALAAVRHQLRKQIFTEEWTAGRSMTIEQAVEALSQAPLFVTEATDKELQSTLKSLDLPSQRASQPEKWKCWAWWPRDLPTCK